jgi:glutathione S-transferase
MKVTLFSLAVSPPGIGTRLMLEHKAIAHRIVYLVPAMHMLPLRLLGFREKTVPALRIDGERIQGSLRIARELERRVPEPPLFPADRRERTAIEEAEAWGESVLQAVVRHTVRNAAMREHSVREWTARSAHIPAPRLVAALAAPYTRWFAVGYSGASDDAARADLARLDELLDEADRLIALGVIGAGRLNAADCQVAPNVRALMAIPELRARIAARPVGALAMRLVPEYPDLPRGAFPAEWMKAVGLEAETSARAEHVPGRVSGRDTDR